MKFRGLEGLRFLSSIAIVLFHYVPYLVPNADPAALPTSHFDIAVDLFFVISRIVIANGYLGRTNTTEGYLAFIRRRIARLLPLHWATLAFYGLIGLAALHGLLQVDSMQKYNFADLLPNILMVQAWGFSSGFSFNYVSWSISAEFFVYLIFPLVALAMSRSAGIGLLFVAAALAAATLVSQAFLGHSLPSLTWNFSIIRALPSFGLGVWLFAHRERLGAMPAKLCSFAFHVSGAALLAAMVLHANEYLLLGLVYVVVASAFICDSKGIATLPSWKPLSSLGQLTYSIYMLHTVMATVLIAWLFPKLLGTSFGATLLAIIAAMAATLLAAALSHRFFETPLRRLLSGDHKAAAVPASKFRAGFAET